MFQVPPSVLDHRFHFPALFHSTRMDQKELSLDANELVRRYKREGHFDKKRKELLDQFKLSPEYKQLLESLKSDVESRVKQDPLVLLDSSKRAQAVALAEGTATRSGASTLANYARTTTIESQTLNAAIKEQMEEFLKSNETKP